LLSLKGKGRTSQVEAAELTKKRRKTNWLKKKEGLLVSDETRKDRTKKA
jgi:hypothetical protein